MKSAYTLFLYEVNLYPILSTLNFEVACFSEMSVLDYKTMLR
jgi:hypothetical protein